MPLRSYIQNRTEILEHTLEEAVRNRSTIDTTHLEQQIDRETNKFIVDVTNRLHQIREQIKSSRPRNNEEADYQIRMEQYRQLVQNSATGVNQMENWINSIFEKVISVVKSIIQWIADNAHTIITIIQNIRDAFKLLTTILNHH